MKERINELLNCGKMDFEITLIGNRRFNFNQEKLENALEEMVSILENEESDLLATYYDLVSIGVSVDDLPDNVIQVKDFFIQIKDLEVYSYSVEMIRLNNGKYDYVLTDDVYIYDDLDEAYMHYENLVNRLSEKDKLSYGYSINLLVNGEYVEPMRESF